MKRKLKPEVPVVGDAPILNRSIVGTDAGNGKALAWAIDNGTYTRDLIPHARIPAVGAAVKTADVDNAAVVEYADWQGSRYGFGDGVWNYITRYPVETHQNDESRYGGDMHLFLIMVTLARMGYKNGEHVTLIVPAPPGLVDSVAPRIKATFLDGENNEGDGRWTIALNGKKPISLFIDKVIVVPEGQGAFFAYRFDAEGNTVPLPTPQGYDALSGRVEIVDLGFGTCDVFSIQDGRVSAESIQHSTDPTGGVSTHIVRPTLDRVRDLTGAQHLTQAHVDGWLRRWAMNGYREEAADVLVSSQNLNLHNLFVRFSERYAEWVIQEKLNPAWRSGADSVMEVGGGWLYIEPTVRRAFPKRSLITPQLYSHTKNLSLVDLNAYGGLVIYAAVTRSKRERAR